MSAAAAPEEKGDGVEAMEVTEAVSHRRQRLSHVVVRVCSLLARQEHGSTHAEGNICEIHTCSQFNTVSSHVAVTRPENR